MYLYVSVCQCVLQASHLQLPLRRSVGVAYSGRISGMTESVAIDVIIFLWDLALQICWNQNTLKINNIK